MYEITNGRGKTLGWSSTMFRAWKRCKWYASHGIHAEFSYEPTA